MAIEIERKFLVTDSSFKELSEKEINISQGYLSTTPKTTIRIRIANEQAFVTIKSKNSGCRRNEWEYEIPLSDGKEILELCDKVIEKTRYLVPFKGHTWEVDVFHGKLRGLVVAEIELRADNETFELPPFVGSEVTGNPYYYNSNLSKL